MANPSIPTAAVRAQALQRLEAYVARSATDKTATLLRAFADHVPRGPGNDAVLSMIVQTSDLRFLAQLLTTTILVPSQWITFCSFC